MKQSELKKWLKKQGATFQEGSSHIKVTLGNKISYLSRHPAKEMRKGTVEAIKKQLGLK